VLSSSLLFLISLARVSKVIFGPVSFVS
jgi:hypothetical protein